MNTRTDDSHTGNTVVWISSWLVGFGVLTVALFPFALPFLILTLVFTLPLLLPLIPLALVAAVYVGIRALVRGGRGRRGRKETVASSADAPRRPTRAVPSPHRG